MTKQTEALKMAIEYLTNIQLDYKGHEVRKAIQEVLDTKQAPCEQPVAWREAVGNVTKHYEYNENKKGEALYTHPALSWQGLTAQEIASIPLNEYTVQTVERMLKEKNT